MRRLLLLVSLFSITLLHGIGCALDKEAAKSPQAPSLLETEGIKIYNTGIGMPIGQILLIKKDQKYCVIKFTKSDIEKDGKEKFSLYEAYFQGDGSGDFSKKNVQFSEKRASYLESPGIGRLYFQLGDPEINCGPFKLGWGYKGFVSFYGPNQRYGDYGIELAPTPWTDIKDVNVFDSRIKWYKFDQQKERIIVPVDELWKENK